MMDKPVEYAINGTFRFGGTCPTCRMNPMVALIDDKGTHCFLCLVRLNEELDAKLAGALRALALLRGEDLGGAAMPDPTPRTM